MKFAKKLIALGLAIAMLGSFSPSRLAAQEYCADIGGGGYEDCRRAPCITPAIALGAVAIIAFAAVAIQNSSSSGHCH